MMRWDIINHLIKENDYKTYLEIGYYKGWSFDRIECQLKIAVDPNPCKTPEQEQFITGRSEYIKDIGNSYIYKMTSDSFFEERKVFNSDTNTYTESPTRYDIIFIDGLH